MMWLGIVQLFVGIGFAQQEFSPEELHPTQFDVGYKEVEIKYAAFKKLTPDARARYLERKKLKLVKWEDRYYVVDGHHDVCVIQRWNDEHPENRLVLQSKKKIKDYAGLSEKKFWKKMIEEELVWNERMNGEVVPADRLVNELPQDFRSLGDNPYRSLAWFVRLVKGFKDMSKPFQEFLFARRLQQFIPLSTSMTDEQWNAKVDEAALRVRAKDFSEIPGFIKKGPPPLSPCNIHLIYKPKAS